MAWPCSRAVRMIQPMPADVVDGAEDTEAAERQRERKGVALGHQAAGDRRGAEAHEHHHHHERRTESGPLPSRQAAT